MKETQEKLRQDIDLMLKQQNAELKYFKKVRPRTTKKVNELCIKEVMYCRE